MRAARVRLLKQCSSMRALGRTAALHPEPDIVRQPKPLEASRVSSPKSPKFTDSLLEGTRFELSSRCRSSGLPQGGSGGPSCRIPAEDSWGTSAAAPSPNDIRSALAKDAAQDGSLRPSFACTWDQGFESLFLQRRVRCKIDAARSAADNRREGTSSAIANGVLGAA